MYLPGMDSSLWRIYISLLAWKEFCSVEDAKPENKDDLYHDAESYFLSPRSLHLAATTEAYRNVLGRIHDPLILEMISVVIKTYNTSSILQKLVQERWLELHMYSGGGAGQRRLPSRYDHKIGHILGAECAASCPAMAKWNAKGPFGQFSNSERSFNLIELESMHFQVGRGQWKA
ncbi:hypothetical protein B0H13DRAFT_1850412 [Mycena leptocephala]|nr:hypothetical protein B0H13DRAFT_1850412 [Mycena leptocephala]